MRGASGRDSGGSGDRNSAPRAAPARRITALSKMRIDHEVGDTPAKLRLLRPKFVDKRHTEDTGPVSDKRRTTGPTPNKPGMTARGGTLRTGDLHPARGAGIDSPP